MKRMKKKFRAPQLHSPFNVSTGPCDSVISAKVRNFNYNHQDRCLSNSLKFPALASGGIGELWALRGSTKENILGNIFSWGSVDVIMELTISSVHCESTACCPGIGMASRTFLTPTLLTHPVLRHKGAGPEVTLSRRLKQKERKNLDPWLYPLIISLLP